MANELTIDLSQNEPNALTAIADQERARLIPKNDFFEKGNQYSHKFHHMENTKKFYKVIAERIIMNILFRSC